jgi:putative oxidoreductase
MKNFTFIGRLLFGMPFIFLGLGHFIELDFFAREITSFTFVGPYTIILTGLMLMAAGVSIIFNKFIQVATICLAFLLLVFIVTIHVPNLLSGDISIRPLTMMAMLKDISLMGGSLIIAGICKEKERFKNNV